MGGTQLAQMKSGSNTLHFTYDAGGMPLTVTYNGTVYYYVTNHAGAPHLNFEKLVPNPLKPGKFQIIENSHVYIFD